MVAEPERTPKIRFGRNLINNSKGKVNQNAK